MGAQLSPVPIMTPFLSRKNVPDQGVEPHLMRLGKLVQSAAEPRIPGWDHKWEVIIATLLPLPALLSPLTERAAPEHRGVPPEQALGPAALLRQVSRPPAAPPGDRLVSLTDTRHTRSREGAGEEKNSKVANTPLAAGQHGRESPRFSTKQGCRASSTACTKAPYGCAASPLA